MQGYPCWFLLWICSYKQHHSIGMMTREKACPWIDGGCIEEKWLVKFASMQVDQVISTTFRSLQDQGRSRHTILQFKSLKEGCQYLEIILEDNGWRCTSIWKQRSGMAMMSKWIMIVHVSTLTLCDTRSYTLFITMVDQVISRHVVFLFYFNEWKAYDDKNVRCLGSGW